MGCHISKSPNGFNQRNISIEFRGHVAMQCGSFGLELNPEELTEHEAAAIPSIMVCCRVWMWHVEYFSWPCVPKFRQRLRKLTQSSSLVVCDLSTQSKFVSSDFLRTYRFLPSCTTRQYSLACNSIRIQGWQWESCVRISTEVQFETCCAPCQVARAWS